MKAEDKNETVNEECKDQNADGLEIMRQRFQLEDADRRAFLKNSLLAFQHYGEEKAQLEKDLREAKEQLRKKKVKIGLIEGS
jgi:hypothetical protein